MENPLPPIDFPTLGCIASDWIEAHCVIPDGFHADDPFALTDEQFWFYVNHYRVRPEATLGQLAPAFFYRRSQLVRPQKWGKSPLIASQVCLEGVGPALFGGWARGGEAWDCREHGCGCGWVYEYEPGEPMGMAWPTPLIQITATSEEQTDNVYDALRPMIDKGPLHDVIPKTGEAFIRLPNKGRIDVVTSNARSRLGQRVTFVPQDETGIWTPQSGMVKVADTQRRGLAGMGGRSVEITNAWDPAENSVAQRTAQSKSTDIYRDHILPPSNLSYRNKVERKRIHKAVYGGSWWVDLDGIEAEAAEIMETDVAQAERFFGNRVRAAEDAYFDADTWAARTNAAHVVPDGALITVGVDGARFDDSLGIIGTEIDTGYQWLIGVWERPATAADDYEHPADEIDGAFAATVERFELWAAYIDPQYIDHLYDRWSGRYGDKKIKAWFTNRPKAICYALRSYKQAQSAGDMSHDGDSTFAQHIANAKRRGTNVRDDDMRAMYSISKDATNSPRKIDLSMAGTLSWEARGDAIAAGALKKRRTGAWAF